MNRNPLRNEKGFVLITLGAATLIMMVFANAFMGLSRSRASQLAVRWSTFVAAETARSGFSVLESALERRMWEVPPDNNCLRAEKFGVKGTTVGNINFEVEATFDVKTRIVAMVGTGDYFGRQASLQKNLRVMDVSDFLVFSKAPGISTMDGVYGQAPLGNNGVASGLVAGARRVYFEGPVQLRGYMGRGWNIPDYPTYLATNPFEPYKNITHVFQGDRLYMIGGLGRYEGIKNTFNPNNSGGAVNWLSNFLIAAPQTVPPTTVNSNIRNYPDPTYPYFTGSLTKANAVLNGIINKTAVGVPPEIKTGKGIYPLAFTGRGLPMPFNASAQQDLGLYLNDPDKWISLNYAHGAGFTSTSDFSCYWQTGMAIKPCGSSKAWPNGFKQWRTDSELDGVLLEAEATPLEFTRINWDNLAALEEEAEECGVVVDEADSSSYDGVHEDCDVTDWAALKSYHDTGAKPCERVLDLNLDTLDSKLEKFDASKYIGVNEGRFVRRVVYVKNRTQIGQTDPQGIWPALANNTTRSNLPIWIVAERELIVKPYQHDMTSPLDERPTERRMGYFNHSVSVPPLNSLSMVMLSPEQVVVVTPTHVPMEFDGGKGSYEDMLNLSTVAGLKRFRPRRTTLTDFYHQEEDGFKYGMRHIQMTNIALITNSNTTNLGAGFYLRGLWGFPDNGFDRISSTCWMDIPDDGKPSNPDDWSVPAASALPDPNFAEGYVPPATSKFYRKLPSPMKWAWNQAWVFAVQNQPNSSTLFFDGLRIVADFDSAVIPPGKRNLNVRYYDHRNWSENATEFRSLFDVSGRRFVWDHGAGTTQPLEQWFEPIHKDDPNGRSCDNTGVTGVEPYIRYWAGRPCGIPGNECLATNPAVPCASTHPSCGSAFPWPVRFYGTGIWGYTFLQRSPSFAFSNLGAITKTDLPTTFARKYEAPKE